MADITMDARAHAIALNEQRLRAWEAGKEILDRVGNERRTMTAEEKQSWERINNEIDSIDEQRDVYLQAERRQVESEKIREALHSQFGERNVQAAEQNETERFYRWVKGDIKNQDGEGGSSAFHVDLRVGRNLVEAARASNDSRELRALLWDTGTSGTLVPTALSSTLYAYMTASICMMTMPTTKLFTTGGNPLDFPKVLAHGIGTQVIAQGTAIGGTDPTFTKMTLNAYKYGQLLQIASETIDDAGVDILGFLTSNIARAVGEIVDPDLVTGAGSAGPQGVMTVNTTAGTIAVGGTAFTMPTYEKLVDLVYSVNGNYRARSSTAFLMNDLTAGAVRKLRDGGAGTIGAVLWQPSLTQGIQGAEPDRLLSYAVYTDPNVASIASNAKVMAFGDFSAYYIRVAEGFTLERSDHYAFNTDLVTFRGKTRIDGDCIDSTALNIMKWSVT